MNVQKVISSTALMADAAPEVRGGSNAIRAKIAKLRDDYPIFGQDLPINMSEKGGVWAADAVYTQSPTQPNGPAAFDTSVIAAARSGKWNTDGVRTYG